MILTLNILQVSIVAKQVENELKPFYTESGAQIAFLHEGKKSHLEIFKKEHALTTLYVWVFRVFSTITAIFGCWLSSKTITLLSKSLLCYNCDDYYELKLE